MCGRNTGAGKLKAVLRVDLRDSQYITASTTDLLPPPPQSDGSLRSLNRPSPPIPSFVLALREFNEMRKSITHINITDYRPSSRLQEVIKDVSLKDGQVCCKPLFTLCFWNDVV